MKKNNSLSRWFALSLLTIMFMSSWINNLYDDINDRDFDIEIYKIRQNDYDSILRVRNLTIDSLKHPIVEKPDPIVTTPKKIVKKPMVLDTIIPIQDTFKTLPLDTFNLKPITDTIK